MELSLGNYGFGGGFSFEPTTNTETAAVPEAATSPFSFSTFLSGAVKDLWPAAASSISYQLTKQQRSDPAAGPDGAGWMGKVATAEVQIGISPAVKTGLIVVGVALVGFLLYRYGRG